LRDLCRCGRESRENCRDSKQAGHVVMAGRRVAPSRLMRKPALEGCDPAPEQVC
jgi:hypothetical protein